MRRKQPRAERTPGEVPVSVSDPGLNGHPRKCKSSQSSSYRLSTASEATGELQDIATPPYRRSASTATDPHPTAGADGRKAGSPPELRDTHLQESDLTRAAGFELKCNTRPLHGGWLSGLTMRGRAWRFGPPRLHVAWHGNGKNATEPTAVPQDVVRAGLGTIMNMPYPRECS